MMLTLSYPESCPAKQRALIHAAHMLFAKYGVRRVTVEEICQTAATSKMTFYKYFDNKWDIAKSVLQLLFDDVIAIFNDITTQEISFQRKIEKIIKLNREQFNVLGTAFIDDVMQHSSPLHPFFQTMHVQSRERTKMFFSEAQQRGHIMGTIEMPFLMFMLDHLSDLLNHADFKAIKPNTDDRICELAAFFFHGFARLETGGALPDSASR